MNGLIGRKLGMTRIFNAKAPRAGHGDRGGAVPVVAVLDGRVELGFGAKKPRTPQGAGGHVKKAASSTRASSAASTSRAARRRGTGVTVRSSPK